MPDYILTCSTRQLSFHLLFLRHFILADAFSMLHFLTTASLLTLLQRKKIQCARKSQFDTILSKYATRCTRILLSSSTKGWYVLYFTYMFGARRSFYWNDVLAASRCASVVSVYHFTLIVHYSVIRFVILRLCTRQLPEGTVPSSNIIWVLIVGFKPFFRAADVSRFLTYCLKLSCKSIPVRQTGLVVVAVPSAAISLL